MRTSTSNLISFISPALKSSAPTVHEIEIFPTLDKVTITFYLDEQWPPYKSFVVDHSSLEAWATSKAYLEVDDTIGSVDHGGIYQERGGMIEISYMDYIMEYMTKEDAVQFLTDKKIITPNEYQYAKGCL